MNDKNIAFIAIAISEAAAIGCGALILYSIYEANGLGIAIAGAAIMGIIRAIIKTSGDKL